VINNTNIKFTNNFRKHYQKSPSKIKKYFDNRLEIFIKDEYSPILNNHHLIGKFKGYRSININGDWRALYSIETISNKTTFIFEALGTHSQLYS
jgi:addiction module RelE/StbE family toxin